MTVAVDGREKGASIFHRAWAQVSAHPRRAIYVLVASAWATAMWFLLEGWVRTVIGSLEPWTVAGWMTAGILFVVVVLEVFFTGSRSVRQLFKLDETWSRFEDIERAGSKIRYGFVPFFPTIKPKDLNSPEAAGFGVEMLKRIFDNRIEPYDHICNWSDVFELLRERKFDIIATPLYETRERSDIVSFSAPLMYVDIGVYCCKENSKLRDVISESQKDDGLTFTQFVQQVKPLASTLTLRGVEGELQMKLCSKYFGDQTNIESFSTSGELKVGTVIASLCDPERPWYTDLFFGERSQAESRPEFGKSVVCLIKPGQLLFPLAFAFRKGEDTLRKYINLRLLEIDGNDEAGYPRNSTILDLLRDSIRDDFGGGENYKTIADHYRRALRVRQPVVASDFDNVTTLRPSG